MTYDSAFLIRTPIARQITGNSISDCRDASILVTANGEQAPAGTHNCIKVKDSETTAAKLPAVFIGSVRDGSLEKNTVQLSTLGEAFKLLNNANLRVGENTVIRFQSSAHDETASRCLSSDW